MNIFTSSAFVQPLLSAQTLYVLCSFVVAILIWVESAMLAGNGGKLPEKKSFNIISLITSSWLIISGIALYFLDFNCFMISVPVVYGIYSLAGWIYMARLVGNIDIPDNPMDMIVPVKYLNFSKSFALVYALLCIFVLVAPHIGLSV